MTILTGYLFYITNTREENMANLIKYPEDIFQQDLQNKTMLLTGDYGGLGLYGNETMQNGGLPLDLVSPNTTPER